MTAVSPAPLPVLVDGTELGLRRVVVPTSVGAIVVRTGRATGGAATILLHGAAGSWRTWTPLIAASDSAGQPLNDVVAIDLPGWGESGDAERVRSVADMADAIAEVARARGYTRWRIVGHSLGGFIALDVAAQHPDATDGVVLVSASGAAVLDAIRRPIRGGSRLPWFAGMLLIMRTLAALGRVGAALIRLVHRLRVLPWLAAPLFAAPAHPSVTAALAGEIRPVAFARAARLAAAYSERRWTAIHCPVRSVRGTRDVFAGETDAAAFVALIPDIREVRLPDAGHFAHIERSDAVLAALATSSMRRHRGRRAVSEYPARREADIARTAA